MVTFDAVERMKRELTDKYVVVDAQAPELKRFVGLTGTVKTVNMSGRALVQFDGAVDIAWYDIDPAYLSIIDKPLPKKVEAKAEPAEKKAAAAPKATGGKSPLELARESAAKAAAAKAGGAAAPAKAAGEMSPLEKARAQGAAKAGGAKPTGGKSPLELAREQGAKKAAAAAETPAPAQQDVPSEEPALAATGETAPPPAAAPVSTVDENGKPLSKIELARRQGAFKGK